MTDGAHSGTFGWGTVLQAGRTLVSSGISDGVIGIIHWHNPSGYTMALGVNSASNTSKYQQYFLGIKVVSM